MVVVMVEMVTAAMTVAVVEMVVLVVLRGRGGCRCRCAEGVPGGGRRVVGSGRVVGFGGLMGWVFFGGWGVVGDGIFGWAVVEEGGRERRSALGTGGRAGDATDATTQVGKKKPPAQI